MTGLPAAEQQIGHEHPEAEVARHKNLPYLRLPRRGGDQGVSPIILSARLHDQSRRIGVLRDRKQRGAAELSTLLA